MMQIIDFEFFHDEYDGGMSSFASLAIETIPSVGDQIELCQEQFDEIQVGLDDDEILLARLPYEVFKIVRKYSYHEVDHLVEVVEVCIDTCAMDKRIASVIIEEDNLTDDENESRKN